MFPARCARPCARRLRGSSSALLLLVVLLSAAVAAPTPSLSASKLSVHVNAQSTDPTFWAWVASTRPRVLKLLDPLPGIDKTALTASPNTTLVGRIWTPQQPVTGDPLAAAAAWLNASLPTILGVPGIVYWEGYNEIDVGTVEEMQWYASMEAERARLLSEKGLRASVGQFSSGVPDVTRPEIIEAMYPMVDAAIAYGGILGLHEYSSPTMQGCWDNSTTPPSGWLTGRYRKLWNQYLAPTNRTQIRIMVSEMGVDNSPCSNSPNLGGWQAYCTYWAQMPQPPPGADCNAMYTSQLQWYDSLLREDAYILGSTIFCYHCQGFASYEVEPVLPDLEAYMNGL